MTASTRWKLTAILLLAVAVLLFLIAYNATTWNTDGVMVLALMFGLGGVFASFKCD